ncbi:hypothetical protein TVAG_196290 [Trichomonas vaginalis G3]|uniref:Uncharacterized protein n=1 Tax=Trichomonas vaginalis (strain ATCC PRA-98 / G3) TaxID=412133 RepID=A2F4W1_TRIV3|nr:hypothetical protein TVAGG3_0088430 [Trichomonas vaginalis G3]EAY00069.1 hypothetical protein TVAG_196290 [Trichomonas vaginalis G3]KAI5543738.1 hypothetical protein TVAGG3_0088430 [Trichomonas vaginalis G3]|eukprot:XP_001312998.1 hypothetical protein [Trichomonas vaginalis G3]
MPFTAENINFHLLSISGIILSLLCVVPLVYSLKAMRTGDIANCKSALFAFLIILIIVPILMLTLSAINTYLVCKGNNSLAFIFYFAISFFALVMLICSAILMNNAHSYSNLSTTPPDKVEAARETGNQARLAGMTGIFATSICLLILVLTAASFFIIRNKTKKQEYSHWM